MAKESRERRKMRIRTDLIEHIENKKTNAKLLARLS